MTEDINARELIFQEQAVNLINTTEINEPNVYSSFSNILGDIQK